MEVHFAFASPLTYNPLCIDGELEGAANSVMRLRALEKPGDVSWRSVEVFHDPLVPNDAVSDKLDIMWLKQ